MAKVPDTSENMKLCICGDCPSYPGTGGTYCAEGKSDQQIDQQGCICGNCSVWEDYGLTSSYYCVEGEAQ